MTGQNKDKNNKNDEKLRRNEKVKGEMRDVDEILGRVEKRTNQS